MSRRRLGAAAATAIALGVVVGLGVAPADASAGGPTCSTTLGVVVHGQHVVHDYVTGGAAATWPPSGRVGAAIAGSGAVIPGGPGPGFHFMHSYAPGASFCLAQSSSPGNHPGLG